MRKIFKVDVKVLYRGSSDWFNEAFWVRANGIGTAIRKVERHLRKRDKGTIRRVICESVALAGTIDVL